MKPGDLVIFYNEMSPEHLYIIVDPSIHSNGAYVTIKAPGYVNVNHTVKKYHLVLRTDIFREQESEGRQEDACLAT